MSIIISTAVQINMAPTNCSSAKSLYSFAKAHRFGSSRKILNHKVSYDLPDMKMNRAASIGYGNRYNFSKGTLSPGPTQYNQRSDFNKIAGSKAFSFGISREAYSKVYVKDAPPNDRSIPGPGQYQ
jgi:hypothetical protein